MLYIVFLILIGATVQDESPNAIRPEIVKRFLSADIDPREWRHLRLRT